MEREPRSHKTLILDAGARLDCNALSPWLRRTGPSDIGSRSGVCVILNPCLHDHAGKMVRTGRVLLPNGRTLEATFQAHRDTFRNRTRWFALCGVCGGQCSILYLEQGPVPLCATCAGIAYPGARVTPSMRPGVRALKEAYGLMPDHEWIRMEWRRRKALAQRVARANRPKAV